MEIGVTEKLAVHAANLRYEDIPQEVIEKAKDCLLDQIGVELIVLLWIGTRSPTATWLTWGEERKARS
jgi:2-methylcitrate dehydratase PrpD